MLKSDNVIDGKVMDASLDNNSIDNGLDPLGIELISSTIENETEINLEEITQNDDSSKHEEELHISVESIDLKTLETSEEAEEAVASVPKMSREMRNLQRSTQDSKVLSNYLNVFDSPRIRNRKTKDTNSSATESDVTIDNVSIIEDKEVPLKGGTPEYDDSDSTIVVRDEVGTKKRRRSLSRSRTAHRLKSVAARSRPKSLSRMLNDEMSTVSDKDDTHEEYDVEDLSNLTSSTAIPIENKAPNPPPKPGWDSFCFKCHLDNAVLSLACKTCKCSFHRHCARLLLTPIPKNPDDFICSDCIDIDKAQKNTVNKYSHPKIDLHTLKEMLTTILEKMRTYPDRECYENDIQFKSNKESNQPLIVTQISLRTIEERIVNNYYKVSEAFLHDVKQLEHNWTIIDRNKTKSLKNIIKFVITEINEMEACVHCYFSSYVDSKWFTIPCKTPHLLIWAKLKGYPYWPAKVMSVDTQKQYADVRFFGAHDRAWITTSQCLIFSEKDPNKVGKPPTPNNNKAATKTQKGIADAMKEKDEYIQNIRQKYGFRYATTREILDANTFQKQLEIQLPNLNNNSKDNNNGNEKLENDGSQKEKLTIKIVKTPDGSQTIEQKTQKPSEKDRQHIVYRVLSKTEDRAENTDQRVQTLILKRNTQSNSSERGKSNNKIHVDDSETSESNLSLQEGKIPLIRRKSIREGPKQRKAPRSIDSRSTTPEPSRKKSKTIEPDNESAFIEEISDKSISKKSRKSVAPLVVSVSNQKIPMGTHEIHSLRESSSSPPRAKQQSINNKRSQSIHRSKSVEKEGAKSDKISRRLSAQGSSTSVRATPTPRIPSKSPSRQSNSQLCSGTSTPVRKNSNNQHFVHPEFNPSIVIKDEPMTDEEILQRDQVTINDIADLVSDGNKHKKNTTILISTSDNSNDSFPQNSRARKSFPNNVPISRSLDTLNTSQIRNSNAMVCIPQVFPSEQEPTNKSKMTNGIHEPPRQSPTTTLSSQIDLLNANNVNENSTLRNALQQSDLPRLVPKPTGVFSTEGNTFQRESGAVAALFSENAHRMTDYFKSLLIDTIGAISSGVSEAHNVLLKLEMEKTKQQLVNLKAEHQLRIDKMNKDHADEIKALKTTYDEKIKNLQHNNDQEKMRIIGEIRQQCEIEKQRAIEATKREIKRVTWCSNCTREARFYCCWNTSYCGPVCQKIHWQTHQKYCTNRNSTTDNNNQSSSSRQNTPESNSVSSSPSPQSVPVTISINYPTNRQILRTIAVPKQNSAPHVVSQQILPAATAITPITSNSMQADSSTNSMRGPQQHTIIQGGKKATIIQTLLPPTYVYQQHKIPSAVPSTALKAISSTLAAEQSLTSNLTNNLVVRAMSQNNSPISIIAKTGNNINDIITPASNSPVMTTTLINNQNTVMLSPSQNLISNNGSIISHGPSALPKT